MGNHFCVALLSRYMTIDQPMAINRKQRGEHWTGVFHYWIS